MLTRIKQFAKPMHANLISRSFAVILDKPKETFRIQFSRVEELALSENPLYVDKTTQIYNFIKFYLREKPLVFFTKPRRFGKSLFLSFVRTFFDGTLDDALYAHGEVTYMNSVRNAAFTGAFNSFAGRALEGNFEDPGLKEVVNKAVKHASERYRCIQKNIIFGEMENQLAAGNAMHRAYLALKKVQFMEKTEAYMKGLSILNPRDGQGKPPQIITTLPVFWLDFSMYNEINCRPRCIDLLQQAPDPESFAEASQLVPTGKVSQVLGALQSRRHVLLIDEHDTVIHQLACKDAQKQSEASLEMKSIFQTAKGKADITAFSVVTGGSKLSSLGLWSGGNQYVDASLEERAADICGYTKKEVEEVLQKVGLTEKLAELEEAYNGYRFSIEVDTKMYNPYALNNYLSRKRIDDYWSKSGLTGSLFEGSDTSKRTALSLLTQAAAGIGIAISTKEIDTPIDPQHFFEVPELILLQAGIFSIKEYDKASDMCTVGFPNEMIKQTTQKTLKAIWFRQLGVKQCIEEANSALAKGINKAFFLNLNKLLKEICKQANIVQTKHDNVLYEHTAYNLIQVARSILNIPRDIVWPEKFNIRNTFDMCLRSGNTMYIVDFKSLREKGLFELALKKTKGSEIPSAISKRIISAAEQAKKYFEEALKILTPNENTEFAEFIGVQMGIENILDYVHVVKYELLQGKNLGKLVEEKSYSIEEGMDTEGGN